MFRHAGAHALYSGNVVERCMRDVQAASRHFRDESEQLRASRTVLLGFEELRLLE